MATAFAAPQYGPQPVQQVTQQWTPTSDFQSSAFASAGSVGQWASVNHHSNNVAIKPPANIEEIQRQWAKFAE